MLGSAFRIFSRGKKTLSIQFRRVPQPRLDNDAKANPFHVILNTPSDLVGRDVVSFDSLLPQEIYSLLWIAMDLKQKDTIKGMFAGKTVGVISSDPVRRISIINAGTQLGAAITMINPSDLGQQEGDSMDYEILGKTLGSACDVMVFDTQLDHKKVEDFATGCTVPVLCTDSSTFCPMYCLGELMTLAEHYNYLRRLTVSYIGNSNDSLLNTYTQLLPKMGMHLHFLTEGTMDSDIWKKGVELSATYNTELKQFENINDSIYRAHVLSAAPNNIKLPELTIEDTKEMDVDWTVLHKNVHLKNTLLSKDLMRCEQSLIWKTISNQQWIFMAAVIATTQGNYSPSILRPQFEGVP